MCSNLHVVMCVLVLTSIGYDLQLQFTCASVFPLMCMQRSINSECSLISGLSIFADFALFRFNSCWTQ